MLLNRESRCGVCRLIVESPASGAWNMAVDEALVEAVAEDQKPTLRIYRWERPTLSLGYFQSYSERESHPPSLGADVVRRLSGGGAILHDRELTYSLILPSTHPIAADTQLLYRNIHQAIVRWFTSFFPGEGVSWRLVLCGGAPNEGVQREQPFLCFQRRSPGDVLLIDGAVAGDHKLVGSAQRRRRGSVLQHGSILWSTSQTAPEVCGFTQLTGLKVPLEEAERRLPSTLLEVLELEGEESPLPDELLAAAEEKRDKRYKVPAWNRRR
jgi:lipoate-protein ligase A